MTPPLEARSANTAETCAPLDRDWRTPNVGQTMRHVAGNLCRVVRLHHDGTMLVTVDTIDPWGTASRRVKVRADQLRPFSFDGYQARS